ncbi:MAG: methyltransferase domain-containing protein [Candidatus Caldarchaeum sp.]
MSRFERFAIGLRVRSLFQNPYRILSGIGLSRGHVFLDVGCGTGFLSLPAASIVGADGVVYAVDVEEDYLQEVERRAERLGLRNIVTVKTQAENLDGVPEHSVDRAIFMLSLHHVADRNMAFLQVRRKLKEDGLMMVFEPIASRLFGHGTDPSEVLALLKQTGFTQVFFNERVLFWRAIARPV